MAKRNILGETLSKFFCTPCNLTYDTIDQLMRHKDDRHGPQVVCSQCHGKSYILPKKRTDVQRRHLVAKHHFAKNLSVNQVRELFFPYFEECETPIFKLPVASKVIVPSVPSASDSNLDTTSPSRTPAHTTQSSALTCTTTHSHTVQSSAPTYTSTPSHTEHLSTPSCSPSLATTPTQAPSPTLPDHFSLATLPDAPLIDDTMVPDSLEAFLTENTPATSVPAVLPDLELDWTFPNPRLSLPVRYQASDSTAATTSDFNSCSTPDIPSPDTPKSPTPQDIPLHSTDGHTFTSTTHPTPRPEDSRVLINGLDGRTPEFPPRKLKVSSRKVTDPRLLFCDAPSGFLAGSMARLASTQRQDIIKNATADNTSIDFELQNFTITRTETIKLADGRTLTMKTSCTLDEHIRISRGTSIQTDED